MVSVIYSRNLKSGEMLVEKVIDWTPFGMPEDRQDAVEEVFYEIALRYKDEREVECESAQNLFSFLQAHPEFAAKPKAAESRSL